MTPLFFGLLVMGGVCIFLGVWFNHTAKGADPELKRRFTLPWGEALQPPPGTPDRLKALRRHGVRAGQNAIAYSVTMAKLGPVLWRVGSVAAMLGLVGTMVADG